MLVSKEIIASLPVLVKNWVDGKADIGKSVYQICSDFVGGGHPAYCEELLNAVINEVRASIKAESGELKTNNAMVEIANEMHQLEREPCKNGYVPIYPTTLKKWRERLHQ